MKLISSSTSPYAQKVRVVALEKGIDLDIENILPLADGAIDIIQNPLGKVPTLILDSGELLFDSVVICQFLDAQNLSRPLQANPQDWNSQRAHALGDGIMDSAFSMVMERNRPDVAPSDFWLERWQLSIERSVAEVDKDIENRPEDFDLGTIAYACALNYLSFRLPEINWKNRYPHLDIWQNKQLQRQSFRETALG